MMGKSGRRSEEVELKVVSRRGVAAAGFEEAMGGDEHIELSGVALDAFGEAVGGNELVERVADVLQFGVEFVTVSVEPALEAFEQVRRKVGVVEHGITVGCNGVQAFVDQGLVTRVRAGQSAFIEPGGGPGDGVEQMVAVALIIGRPPGIEAQTDGLEQFVVGAGEQRDGVGDGGHRLKGCQERRRRGAGLGSGAKTWR